MVSIYFPVILKEKKLFVELKNPWVPPPDRMAQAFADHLRVVTAADEAFTTNLFNTVQGYWVVRDANLFCRFLDGKVNVEELKKHAKETIAEVLAQSQLESEERRLEKKIKEQAAELDKLRPRYDAALNLADAVGAKWHFGKRRRVKDALAHFYRRCD